MKIFKRLIILSVLITIIVLPLFLPIRVSADESLWALDGRPTSAGGSAKYDTAIKWSVDTLANTRYYDEGDRKIGGNTWWHVVNNLLCMHPSNNDSSFGGNKSLRAFIVIDVNKSGNEPDLAEIYVAAGDWTGGATNDAMTKVATFNDSGHAERACLCTLINQDTTTHYSWAGYKATFNHWWNSNYSFYGNKAGKNFPDGGYENDNSRDTEILNKVQEYGSKYKSESTQYQSRLIIFGGGKTQRRGLVFGQECEGGSQVEIEKYITKIEGISDADLNQNLNDARKIGVDKIQKEKDKQKDPVESVSSDIKVTYKIIIRNKGKKDVTGTLEDTPDETLFDVSSMDWNRRKTV